MAATIAARGTALSGANTLPLPSLLLLVPAPRFALLGSAFFWDARFWSRRTLSHAVRGVVPSGLFVSPSRRVVYPPILLNLKNHTPYTLNRLPALVYRINE